MLIEEMIQVHFYENIISQLWKRSKNNNKMETDNTHSIYQVVNRCVLS